MTHSHCVCQGGHTTHTEPQSCPACATSLPASGTDTDTRGRGGSNMRGWSARQCCSGGCCDVLGMPVSLGCKKEAIAAEKSMEKQASVHQHCRGSGSAPRASLPRAHRGPDPQGSASVGLSSLRRKLETHLSVSLSHLYRVHLPP